jgi:hypothetical protein
MNEVIFMKGWGVIIIIVSLYVLLMHSEKNDRVKPISDEVASLSDMWKSLKGLLMNKNLHYLVITWAGYKLFSCFDAVSTIYLLQEKNYDQMKYSFISAISFPIRIILSFMVSKKVYDNPFKFLYYCQFCCIPLSLIYINLVLFYYDDLMAYNPMLFDICLLLTTLVSSVLCAVSSACAFAQFSKVCDTEIAGTHITIFTSLSNLTGSIPLLYCYRIIDSYGMFVPNAIGLAITLVLLVLLKPIVTHLGQTKREDWADQTCNEKLKQS